MATAAILILSLLAYLIARTTIYSITSRRVVMRFGVALPMTVNIPFKAIRSADVAAQPSFRAVPDAQNVSSLLSRALHSAAGSPEMAKRPQAVVRPATTQTVSGGAAPAAA